jgi:hypothetical protein
LAQHRESRHRKESYAHCLDRAVCHCVRPIEAHMPVRHWLSLRRDCRTLPVMALSSESGRRLGIQLPGRLGRANDQPITSTPDAVHQIGELLTNHIRRPFVSPRQDRRTTAAMLESIFAASAARIRRIRQRRTRRGVWRCSPMAVGAWAGSSPSRPQHTTGQGFVG